MIQKEILLRLENINRVSGTLREDMSCGGVTFLNLVRKTSFSGPDFKSSVFVCVPGAGASRGSAGACRAGMLIRL